MAHGHAFAYLHGSRAGVHVKDAVLLDVAASAHHDVVSIIAAQGGAGEHGHVGTDGHVAKDAAVGGDVRAWVNLYGTVVHRVFLSISSDSIE